MPPRHLNSEQHRGIVPTDQLGTGTANSTKYLAGDSTWQTTPIVTGLADLQGYAWKTPVRAATSAAGTLASSFENGDTVGGAVVATGDRILIKNQADATENGIYVVNASGAPTRATDADSGAELIAAAVSVGQGTNQLTSWVCTSPATITVGSTLLTFAQLRTNNDAPFYVQTMSSIPILVMGPALGTGSESEGASVVLQARDGVDYGGGIDIPAGDATEGYGADLNLSGGNPVAGGDAQLFAGDGKTGNPGGDAILWGGYGDDGTDDPGYFAAHGGDGSGNFGKVEIYSDGSTGSAYQILTAVGDNTATWQDIDGGSP